MSLAPEDIYPNFHEKAVGTQSLQEAYAGADEMRKRLRQRAVDMARLSDELGDGWRGAAADGAANAMLPLAQAMDDTGVAVSSAHDLIQAQAQAFHDTAAKVRPLPAEPGVGDYLGDYVDGLGQLVTGGTPTDWVSSYSQQQAYNATNDANVTAVDHYHAGSTANAAFASQGPRIDAGAMPVGVTTPRSDVRGVGLPDIPRTNEPGADRPRSDGRTNALTGLPHADAPKSTSATPSRVPAPTANTAPTRTPPAPRPPAPTAARAANEPATATGTATSTGARTGEESGTAPATAPGSVGGPEAPADTAYRAATPSPLPGEPGEPGAALPPTTDPAPGRTQRPGGDAPPDAPNPRRTTTARPGDPGGQGGAEASTPRPGSRSGAGPAPARQPAPSETTRAAQRSGAAEPPVTGGSRAADDDRERRTASYLVTDEHGSAIVGELPEVAPPVIGA